MIPPLPALLETARQAAQAAGDHVLARLHRRDDAALVTRHDIKHTLDRESQAVATDAIRRAFPGHAILGEETAEAALPASDVRWVIDPIDGTINFAHGLPMWCVSVAAQAGGRSVAGVVLAPELGLRFEALADGPATCNGRPLRVSSTARLDHALVHTGADRSEEAARAFRFLNRLAGIVQRPRVIGSAALDICWVAAGRTDAYFESGVFLWDIAAAGLILERAGGTGEVLHAGDGYKVAFLATNGLLHHGLRGVLAPLL